MADHGGHGGGHGGGGGIGEQIDEAKKSLLYATAITGINVFTAPLRAATNGKIGRKLRHYGADHDDSKDPVFTQNKRLFEKLGTMMKLLVGVMEPNFAKTDVALASMRKLYAPIKTTAAARWEKDNPVTPDVNEIDNIKFFENREETDTNYVGVGAFTSLTQVSDEISEYIDGTDQSILQKVKSGTLFTGDPLDEAQVADLRYWNIKSKKRYWRRFEPYVDKSRDPFFEEDLFAIGKVQASDFVQGVKALSAGVRSTESQVVASFVKNLQALFTSIREQEGAYSAYLQNVKEVFTYSKSKIITKLRDEYSVQQQRKDAPYRIRYWHTHKIIKLFHVNKDGSVEKFSDAYPNFQRDEDISPGVDYRGMPLEVDEKGYVLVDQWVAEIGENDFQRQLAINQVEAGVPIGFNGTVQNYLRKGVWARVDTSGRAHPATTVGGILTKKHLAGRKVDKKWIENVGDLEYAGYCIMEWDGLRDDFRDGRYHQMSTTLFDHLSCPFKMRPEVSVGTSFKVKKKHFSKKKGYGWSKIPAKRYPVNWGYYDDTNVNLEDIRYTSGLAEWASQKYSYFASDDTLADHRAFQFFRKYKKYKYQAGKYHGKDSKRAKLVVDVANSPGDARTLRIDATPVVDTKYKRKYRTPGNFSPAFDLAALYVDNTEWTHWGRMYYYEPALVGEMNVTPFGMSPDPMVTTRGLSMYLIDKVINEAGDINIAQNLLRTAAEEFIPEGFDYGVRVFGKRGTHDPMNDMIKDSGPMAWEPGG